MKAEEHAHRIPSRHAGGVRRRVGYSAYPTAVTVGAAAALYFGYADLWNGGISMSALWLVMGYVIMVPLAVMAVPRRT